VTRELTNVSEAARRTGVPRTTINRWISAERLFVVGLDRDGVKLYDLSAVRRLAEGRRRLGR
jgi:hypothetical protein